jgi:carboxylesterase type B
MLIVLDPLASSQLTQSIFNNPPPVESEDCLYLNVYAPATPAGGAGRAVLFWIYGGSLQFGTAGKMIRMLKLYIAICDHCLTRSRYSIIRW